MITDLFASSNQNINLSAVIANQGASKKGKNLNDFDGAMEKPANSLDFASLLSQTLNTGFGIESEDSSTNIASILKSSESSSQSLSGNFQLLTSFRPDSFNSSPFVNISEKNSIQKSTEVVSKKDTSIEKDATSSTNKKEETQDSKEDEEVEKEEQVDTDKVISENVAQPVIELELESEEISEVTEENSELELEVEQSETTNVLEFAQNLENNSDKTAKETKDVDTADSKEIEFLDSSSTTEEIAPIENTETIEATDTQLAESNVSEKAENTKSDNEKDSKFDEIVKELKSSDSTLPEESLRQKFAEATGQEKHAEAEAVDNSMNQTDTNNVVNQSAQAVVVNNSSNDESLNRDFSTQSAKNESINAKVDHQSKIVMGNGAGNAAKGFTMNQNNNSGSNSNFSFQSTVAQNYNQNGKIAQSPNTQIPSFAEFLNKAEMVKTKDGAKVMNIEVEQDGLGKLELELTSKDGEVTARLSAESDLAKAKLEELAPQIKENLIEKGVNLTQINVDVSSKDADENGEKFFTEGKNKSRKIKGISSNSVKEIVEKKILPNLRRVALNIQSVDLTV